MPDGSVVISPPKGYFASTTAVAHPSSGNITVPLVDGVTGAGGAGNYEVVFVANELSVFGSGTNGPALHVVKGTPPYSRQILRGWQFSVDATGKVIGAKDLRTYGGVGSNALQSNAASVFRIETAGDASMSPGSGTDGYVIYWNNTAGFFELQAPTSGATELSELTDVNTTGGHAPTAGQVLTWNGTDTKWEPVTPTTGVTTLAALSDVEATGGHAPTNGQVLTWISADSKWAPGTLIVYSTLASLTDVEATGGHAPTNGQVLTWISADTKWAPTTLVLTLASLSDVAATGSHAPTAGQALIWNGTDSKWEPTTLPSSGATALSALTDVATTGSHAPSNGQVLTWIAADSKWEPTTVSGGGGGSTTLAGLTDVSIPSPTNGQVLEYNSTTSKWNAVTPSGGGGGSYDATILAESSLTHFWKLNDAAGATSAADSKGSTPLTLVGSGPTFGLPSIVGDGETSVMFYGNASNYLALPSGSIPSSGDFSIEMVIAEFISQSIYVMFDLDSTGASLSMYFQPNGGGNPPVFCTNANGVGPQYGVGRPQSYAKHIVCSVSRSSGITAYVNGVPWQMTTSFTSSQTSAGLIGRYSSSGSTLPYEGLMSKFAIYNVALTQAQVNAHLANINAKL